MCGPLRSKLCLAARCIHRLSSRPVTASQPDRPDAVKTQVAPNGVEVHLLATERERSSLCLWSVEGALNGPRAATALLPDLLTRGSAASPGLADMAARCEELYDADLLATVTAHGPQQVLRFGVEVLADRYAGGRRLFDEATALLAETLRDPPLNAGRFREDHLEQERLNLVRSIEGLADDKGLLAWRRMVETMHADTPFAQHSWGSVAEAEALAEPTVRAAWESVRDEAPARLVVVGDVSLDDAIRAALVLGGDSPRKPPTVHGPPRLSSRTEPRRVSHSEPLAQSQLVLGYAVDADALSGPACALAAAAFGGGSHSRLFKRVREAEGLAYGCGASLLSDSATLVVSAGLDADAAPHVVDAVAEELARLVAGDLSEAEFELSRSAVLRRLDVLQDRPRDIAGYRLYGLATGREFRPEEAARAVAELTVDQVCQAAGAFSLDTAYLLEGSTS